MRANHIPAGRRAGLTETRPLREIAADIRDTWDRPYFGAVPRLGPALGRRHARTRPARRPVHQ
jgi:hypothetical protein